MSNKRSGRYLASVRIVSLREEPPPTMTLDTVDAAFGYWRDHIATAPDYRPEQEQFVVVMVNARRKILGHQVVCIGIVDQVHIHARETFRAAIIQNAHAIIVMHNHPSGDPLPSESDIRGTRDLVRAGTMLKIDVLDHLIIGNLDAAEVHHKRVSLRELGYFHS